MKKLHVNAHLGKYPYISIDVKTRTLQVTVFTSLAASSPQQESGVVSWTGGAVLPSLSVDRGQSILSPVSPPHQLHHLAPASQG